jgi:hypothetical protein
MSDKDCTNIGNCDKGEFERFVGIGNCCITRFQIDFHLKERFKIKDTSLYGGGQLFDWLVIHNYAKFATALENNLSGVFELADLLVGPSWTANYRCVKNINYEMTWNHLFTRQGNNVPDNILDLEYDARKQKIDYLIKKFKTLNQYRTLYILAYPFTGNGDMGTIEPDLVTVIRIRNALEQLRGNNNFTLLFASLQNRSQEDLPNIHFRTIVKGSKPAYEGDFNCWNTLLSEYPFRIDQVASDTTEIDNTVFSET